MISCNIKRQYNFFFRINYDDKCRLTSPPGSEVIQAGEGFPLSMSGGGGGAGANTLISPTPFQPQQPQGERFPTAGQPRPGNKMEIRISL